MNVKKVLKGYTGKEIFIDKDEPFTLRQLIALVCNNPKTKEGKQIYDTAEDKTKIFAILTTVWQNDNAKLTIQEKNFLIERAKQIENLYPLHLGLLIKHLNEEDTADVQPSSDNTIKNSVSK